MMKPFHSTIYCLFPSRRQNFTCVCRSEEFTSLPVAKVRALVASDELNVEKEEVVYEAVIAWVAHDLRARGQHLGPLLLAGLRFPLVAVKFLEDFVCQNPLIPETEEGRALLGDVRVFLESPEKLFPPDANKTVAEMFPLRSGMIQPEHCILLVGGILNQITTTSTSAAAKKPSSINCYNPLTREAFFMARFPSETTSTEAEESQEEEEEGEDGDAGSSRPRRYYCVEDPAVVVTEDNLVYAAGGNYIHHAIYSYGGEGEGSDLDPSVDSMSFGDFEDEESVRKDVFVYDNDHDRWTPRAPMLFPKSNFTLAAVGRKLYSFGGLTLNQHPTEIVESYDADRNQWSYVGMMPTTLVDLQSVALRGEVYLLGGRTGVGAHNVLIKFDPRRNEWTSLAGMPTPRFNFGAIVVEDGGCSRGGGGDFDDDGDDDVGAGSSSGDLEIMVAGGQIYSHSTNTIRRDALRSCEIYNVSANQWRQGPELTAEMYNVSLMRVNGCLYALGTSETQRSPFRIHRYNVVCRLDPAARRWVQLESDLCDVRSFASVAARLYTRKLSQVFRPEVDT